MAQSPARDAQDFARLMFQTIERLGQDGGWVRARAAFDQTAADHPDHVYVARIEARPARRIGSYAAAERVREAEFPHIERRKVGTRRNAPVMYRSVGPTSGSTCTSPRHAAEPPAPGRRRAGMRRAPRRLGAPRCLDRSAPNSPWRRRLLRRVTAAGGALGPASWSLRSGGSVCAPPSRRSPPASSDDSAPPEVGGASLGEPAEPPAAIMVAATCAPGFAPADDHLGIGGSRNSHGCWRCPISAPWRLTRASKSAVISSRRCGKRLADRRMDLRLDDFLDLLLVFRDGEGEPAATTAPEPGSVVPMV